jgi:hypothetical protein
MKSYEAYLDNESYIRMKEVEAGHRELSPVAKKCPRGCCDYTRPTKKAFPELQLHILLDCTRPTRKAFPELQLNMLLVSRQVTTELEDVLYNKWYLKFKCTCAMEAFMINPANEQALQKLRGVLFSWMGERSDTAIGLLQKLPNLKFVSISLSKSTLPVKKIVPYLVRHTRWPQATTGYTSPHYDVRVEDALGLAELLSIRGLKHPIGVAAQGWNRPDVFSVALGNAFTEQAIQDKPQVSTNNEPQGVI